MNKNLSWLLMVGFLLSACAPQAIAKPKQAPTIESAVAPTSSPETVHLKLGYQPFLSSAAFFIAEDGGYFSEQGLDVELVRFNNGAEVLTALLAGDIDLSAENLSAGAINLVAGNSDYKFVGERGFIDPQAECSYQDIMVRTDLLKDGFLDTPEHVKGLKFATTPASVFEYGLDVQLNKMGLTPDDIQFISMPSQPDRLAALKNNAVDVVTSAEPWLIRTKKSGAADTWVSFASLTPNLPLSVVLYGPKLTGNPDVGNRLMLAYLKAIRQYHEGKTDANIAVITKYTELSADDVKASCWVSIAADGRTHLDAWIPYEEWLVSKGYLDAVVPTDKLWDSQFVDFANAALK